MNPRLISNQLDSLHAQKLLLEKKESPKIQSLKQTLKQQNQKGLLSNKQDALDELMIAERDYRIKVNQLEREIRSLELLKKIADSKEDLYFERIIVGAGVAGTAVFSEIPFDVRNKENDGFPAILVLNDPTNVNQWPKDGVTLMGQESSVQTPAIFSAHSDDFVLTTNKTRNPYDYVMADHFTMSLIETQNDLNMSILNLAAAEIQSQDNPKQNSGWKYPEAKHRIVIHASKSQSYYFYTSAIDICTGPGLSRKLEEKQIESKLSEKLISNNHLIYGQDNGDPKLQGDVVFYGGGARNAALMLDIILGAQPDAKIMQWVAYNTDNFNIVKNTNRMFHFLYHHPEAKMGLGVLESVTQLPSGKLSLKFSGGRNQKDDLFTDMNGKTLLCDQLVVSIGQQLNPLTQSLSGFKQFEYSSSKDQKQMIPIGGSSQDGSIITWGAAGATNIGTFSPENWRTILDKLLKHARTLPAESQAMPGIYRSSWTIKKLAEKVREINVFPAFQNYFIKKLNLDELNSFDTPRLVSCFKKANPELSDFVCEKYAIAIMNFRKKFADTDPFPIKNNKQVEQILHLYQDVHQFDLPDINKASIDELVDIIKCADQNIYGEDDLLKYAEMIIKLRSTLPAGIENSDQLKTIFSECPNLWRAIHLHYFNFTNPILFDERISLSLQGIFAPKKSPAKSPMPIDIDRETDVNSTAFTSTATFIDDSLIDSHSGEEIQTKVDQGIKLYS